MDYILMNKDTSCALFSCTHDEFGEEHAILWEWYTDLRPIGPGSLTAWLEKRKAPKHRKHIEPLSEFLACQLAELLCPQAVHCDLGFYHHKLISKRRLFTDEQHRLAKISDFPDRPTTVSGLLELYSALGETDALRRMFVLDDDQLFSPDYIYIRKCRSRIGVDFIKTARGMLTEDIRQELKNPDGFCFAPHPTIELPEARLERLSRIAERQRRAILA